MEKSKARGPSSPKSLAELVEFFDTHDMGDYWEQMPEADFDVDIKRRTHLVAIDETLAARLTEIAKSDSVSTETLIDRWLREKVSERKESSRS